MLKSKSVLAVIYKIKMKKIIFVLLLVCFLALGLTVFLNIKNNRNFLEFISGFTKNKNENSTADFSQEDVIINYTDSGFLPNVVHVKKNGKVVFINQSEKPMLIASAPHPQNSDYPELNAKEVLKKGGSYAFVFSKVGRWGFNNHLSPNETGLVFVDQK